jgi:hypothetical protein
MRFDNVPDDPQTAERLTAILDPAKRAGEAAEIARKARDDVDELRDARNVALLVLHLRHGVSLVTCYRDIGRMDRWTLDKWMGRAPATMRADPADVDWDAVEMDDLQRMYRRLLGLTAEEVTEIARSMAAGFWARTSTWRTAMRIRDKAAKELMDGLHGPPWSNAEVSRLTGMKTSAAARLRNQLESPPPARVA